MDIAHQCQSVAILIDQVSLEPSLEDMSDPCQPGIEIAGIAKRQILHARRQFQIPRLQRKVKVIGHQAEGVDPVAEAGNAFGEQLIEEVPVTGSQEHVLPGIATQDDVIQTASDVQARFASHEPIPSRRAHYAIYQARPHSPPQTAGQHKGHRAFLPWRSN
jgi:hypothetical protein